MLFFLCPSLLLSSFFFGVYLVHQTWWWFISLVIFHWNVIFTIHSVCPIRWALHRTTVHVSSLLFEQLFTFDSLVKHTHTKLNSTQVRRESLWILLVWSTLVAQRQMLNAWISQNNHCLRTKKNTILPKSKFFFSFSFRLFWSLLVMTASQKSFHFIVFTVFFFSQNNYLRGSVYPRWNFSLSFNHHREIDCVQREFICFFYSPNRVRMLPFRPRPVTKCICEPCQLTRI